MPEEKRRKRDWGAVFVLQTRDLTLHEHFLRLSLVHATVERTNVDRARTSRWSRPTEERNIIPLLLVPSPAAQDLARFRKESRGSCLLPK